MPNRVLLQRRLGSLIPADEAAQEAVRRVKEGQCVYVEMTLIDPPEQGEEKPDG